MPDKYIARVVDEGFRGVDLFVLGVFVWAPVVFGNVYHGLARHAFDKALASIPGKTSVALSRSMAWHPEVQSGASADPPAGTFARAGADPARHAGGRVQATQRARRGVDSRGLDRIGIADPIDSWRERVVAAGGRMSASGRLCFPRAMVEDAIARAGRNFVLCGRDPRHDMDVSGTRVHFGGGSATVEILDADTGKYRETRLIDLYDTVRLEDALDNMHFYIRSCIPRDLTEARDVDINTAYACMAGTTKFFFTSFYQPEHLDEAVAMFDISLGGDGSGERFRTRPFAASNCTFVVAPLRFAADACRVLDAAVRNGMPAVVISVGQAGATAPVALAGTLTQGNAEVLAGLTAMNLLAPGHPLLLGNCPFVSDLRTGSFAGGGGEMALLAAGAAQMANFYDLPSWVTSGMSSSKLPDAQSGWEKGYLTALPALAGANIIVETAGVLADIIAISLEAFTLDIDMVSGVIRAVRGIEVDDDTLSVEVIPASLRITTARLSDPIEVPAFHGCD